ncbi:hypothetical protein MNBD_GAMMA01-91, partial [hydrothermal vent metagenome]
MNKQHECDEDTACAIDFSKESEGQGIFFINKEYLKPAIGLFFLLLGIGWEFFEVSFFTAPLPLIWFGIIYLVIGGPIVLKAAKLILKGDIYN